MPLFFVDRVRRIIGAAHAGWRGTALGMAAKMVDAFVGGFASRPEDILAVVGPAVGPCCYQVDAPVHAALGSAMPVRIAFCGPAAEEGRWMLDLALANRLQIAGAGCARSEYPFGRSLHRLPAGALLFAPRERRVQRQTGQPPDAAAQGTAEKMLDSGDRFGIEENQNTERCVLSPSFWIDSKDQISDLKKSVILFYKSVHLEHL